jgi:O-antigen/teichoic acid export membrane protein
MCLHCLTEGENWLLMQPLRKISVRERTLHVYRSFIGDSFYRNSTYLLISMGVSTVSGFLFVVLCAHLFTQASFGYATSLLGALGLATAFANIGMNQTVVRFMGRSKNKSQDMVTNIVLVSAFSMLSGIVLSHFFSSFGIKHADTWVVLIFIATAFLSSIKPLFDTVFIAIRESSGTLIENSLFCVARLLFPLFVVGSGYLGIFSAQLAGVIIAIAASVILLRKKHGFNFFVKPSRTSMDGKWRFAIGAYTSDLVGGLPTSVLPIIVVAKLGPVNGALWYVAMQVTNVLLTVSGTISQSMFAEMANAEDGIYRVLKKASLTMYGLLIPLSAAVYFLAPFILRLLHGDYVAAEHVLRLMTIFALIGVANYITGSILQVYKKVLYLTIVNTANAVVVIVYCLVFAHNLNGIAYGWMYGEVVNFVMFVAGGVIVARRNHGSLAID